MLSDQAVLPKAAVPLTERLWSYVWRFERAALPAAVVPSRSTMQKRATLGSEAKAYWAVAACWVTEPQTVGPVMVVV